MPDVLIVESHQEGGLCQANCGREYDRILVTENGPMSIDQRKHLERQKANRVKAGLSEPTEIVAPVTRMLLCRVCLVRFAVAVFEFDVKE